MLTFTSHRQSLAGITLHSPCCYSMVLYIQLCLVDTLSKLLQQHTLLQLCIHTYSVVHSAQGCRTYTACQICQRIRVEGFRPLPCLLSNGLTDLSIGVSREVDADCAVCIQARESCLVASANQDQPGIVHLHSQTCDGQ